MKGKPNFKSYWFENLDHMFFEGSGKAKPADVLNIGHVSKSIGDRIGEFVTGTK